MKAICLNFYDKYGKYINFFAIYTLVFVLLIATLRYTLPFIIGGVVAYLLRPPTKFLMDKWRVKPHLATLITTAIFYLVLISVLGFVSIVLMAEVTTLISKLEINKLSNIFNDLKLQGVTFYENLDPEVIGVIKGNMTKITSTASTMTISFLKSLFGTLTSIPYLIMVTVFSIISTYFTSNELLKIHSINTKGYEKAIDFMVKAKEMGGKYIGAYILLILLTFIEALILFNIIGAKYVVLLALLCAFLDLLPVVGIGSVFTPYALISYFIMGDTKMTISLLVCWGIMVIVRQVLEPKLLSNSLDISPLLTLMSIFIGLTAYGVTGILFCIFMIIAYKVCKNIKLL